MKPHVIALLTNDPAVRETALQVIPEMRHGLRILQSSRAVFEMLRDRPDDVDLAVIDLDPGVHGLTVLEAIDHRLPTLVLTSLEENYMKSIAERHGAVGCLTKPFTDEQLTAAIDHALRALAAQSEV